jgi:WD40 repeat protein
LNEPDRPDPPSDGIHLDAVVVGPGTVNQAVGDLHVHYLDGAHRVLSQRDDAETVCPYPGLAAFTSEQAGWFFGRDRLTADLLRRLDTQMTVGRPVMVVAPSGAGKSSLLQAGLLHQIASGALPAAGSRDWPHVLIVPGAHPMRQAAAALAGALPSGGAGLPASPLAPASDDLDTLLDRVARGSAASGKAVVQVVLVVDQFEELFTLCEDPAERAEFISWLWRACALGQRRVPAVVVCGLRADFYAECLADHAELRRSLEADQLVVGPMSAEELRQAIIDPALAAGLHVEPGLTELLLADLRANRDGQVSKAPAEAADYDAGRLPLLAHALRATWQQRHGTTLTVDGYRITGGIDHAIAETADRVYTGLDQAGQHEAKMMFLRLVKIGPTASGDARCPVARAELAVGAAAEAVLGAFISSRLLTSTRDAVQITHEALLSAWPTLKGWLEEDRAADLIRQRIEDAAAGWGHNPRDASLLYRGASLETAAGWECAHTGDLTPTASRFLAASRKFAHRATIIRRGAIAILATLTVIAGAAAGVASWQNSAADQQRDQARFDQVVAEIGPLQGTDQSLATQLNLVAHRMNPTTALTDQLLSTSVTPLADPLSGPGPIRSVAFSPDGRILAVGSADSHVWLWNVADPARPEPLGQPLIDSGPVATMAFSPDGRTLVAGSDNGTIRLWNISNPAQPAAIGLPLPVAGALGGVPSLAFSPDGRTLAAGSGDGKVWLWNVADSAHSALLGQPLSGPANIVYGVAFSPNGRTLAAGSLDHRVWLWNVTDLAHPVQLGQPLTGPANIVYGVAFSPDGRTLAAGSADDKVWLWNVTNPAHPVQLGQPLTGPASFVYSVAFSPNGRTLAAGSADDKVWLWNTSNPAQPAPLGQPLTGASGGVASVAFNPDGRTLAAGDIAGRVWLWNLPSTVLSGPASYVNSVAYSPDGRTLAAGSADDKVWLWNTSNPARPKPLGQLFTAPAAQPLNLTSGGVASVAFSPDGRTLAAGSAADKVWLWNVTDPAHPVQLGQPLTGPANIVASVAFSPDGRTLAAGSIDGKVWLWNTADPAHPVPLGQPLTGANGPVYSVAFSPDGRTLAAGSGHDQVWLWNVTDPAHPAQLGQPLTGPANFVDAVAFSPDGRTLAAGSIDDKVWLWNVTDPAHPVQLGQPLTGPANFVYSVAFSPDGRTLAAGSADDKVWLWNIAGPARPAQVGQPLTGPGTALDAVAFSPDGRTVTAGAQDGVIWSWDLDLAPVIDRICTITSGDLNAVQWSRYIPLPYDPPCRPTHQVDEDAYN